MLFYSPFIVYISRFHFVSWSNTYVCECECMYIDHFYLLGWCAIWKRMRIRIKWESERSRRRRKKNFTAKGWDLKSTKCTHTHTHIHIWTLKLKGMRVERSAIWWFHNIPNCLCPLFHITNVMMHTNHSATFTHTLTHPTSGQRVE